MTGYSSGRLEDEHFSLALSLKSSNHRFLDLQLRLPAALEFFEPQARLLLKEQILRGHVELAVNLERLSGAALRLDRTLLDAYLKTCRAIREEFAFSSEPDLVALLRIPGVVTVENEIPEEKLGRARQALEKVLLEVINRLNRMRAGEGETLARDLESRLEKLQKLGATVSELSGLMLPAFRERLERRVRDLAGAPEMDPARLAQEVTALAMRSDITEEVTRFRSHVEQARNLLAEGNEIGKKLDFLLQEMNREANTTLAKTTDVPGAGARIASCAIEMKFEIEKLREQAQNIE